MKKFGKTLLNISLDLVIAAIILLAVIISVSTFTARANNGVPSLLGYMPFSIQTDSMNPTIKAGDYILVEACDADHLQADDIISYFTMIEGRRVINTHRIVQVSREDGMIFYQTQGDNGATNPTPDQSLIAPGDVIGIYSEKKISGLGYVMTFLSSQMGFFICILLPVFFFTIYQIYQLILIVMHNKKVAMMEEIKNGAPDAVKEAIIAEYLKTQSDQKDQTSDAAEQ